MRKREGFCLRPETVLAGRYRLKGVLGVGGFGITYRAEDEKEKRTVAVKEFFCRDFVHRAAEQSAEVKLVDDGRASAYGEAKQEFLKEARVLNSLGNLPEIVQIMNHFEENDTAYLVMECLDGITLRQHLRRHGRFGEEEAVRLFLPVLHALGKIHERGIIHRDISPDNLMVLNDGSMKLLDFGSAKAELLQGRRSRFVVLKSGYAPCEQYDESGQQGPWTDIYALCATIYECVTGQKPVSSTSRAVYDELRTFSELGIKGSATFERILRKGLEVYWQERYQSAEEMAEALKLCEQK